MIPTAIHGQIMQSRTRRLTLWIVLPLVVGIGGLTVYWAKYGQLDAASPTAGVQKAPASGPASPLPRAEASEEALRAATVLQETIKDLQSSQKQLQDRLDRFEMQLTKEQGEFKGLSEQVGALSSRVDGLSTPPPASTGGGISQTPKKKR